MYNRLYAYNWPVEKAFGKKAPIKHGFSRTDSEYNAWSDMKARCNTPTHKSYPRYGGRGITVCARWQDSFLNFIEDMGTKPSSELSLDRIDNDGDYEPDNCHWTNQVAQARNTSVNRLVTYKGQTKCMAEWLEVLNLPRQTMEDRIDKGWSVEKAFETPIKEKEIFLTYRGETMNMAQWAGRIGISTGCISSRLKKNWPVEKIIETKSAKAKIFFNGKYKTIGEWAEEYNINRNSVRKRLNKGWDFEKALTHKKWEKTG